MLERGGGGAAACGRSCAAPRAPCAMLCRSYGLPERGDADLLAHRAAQCVTGCKNRSSSSQRTPRRDRKSTRLNSSHDQISYAVFCLKKKKQNYRRMSLKQKQKENEQ